MKLQAAIILGKSISFLSRSFKLGGGSAAPGLYALRVYPALLEHLSKQIPINIVITGTNGKTTTARMLAHLAQESGLKVIRNHTGSNLERGIASALLRGTNVFHIGSGLGSHIVFDLGIWELDEAAFNSVAPKIKPEIVVFLNVFRDQLDRYGEVDSLVKKWGQTVKKLPKRTTILINGDDANTAKLAYSFRGGVETFGVEKYKIQGESVEQGKGVHLNFEAKNIILKGLRGTSFQLTMNNERFTVNLPIPGIYHIYDALAALSVAHHLNLPIHRLTDSLKHYQPAFGRVEQFALKGHSAFIFLIKNPAGATQVFETIAPVLKKNDRLLIALNDNLADGTDVSWIWDGDFEQLTPLSLRGNLVFVSGSRAHDLAVRLKYAGFYPKQIKVEPNLERAFGASQRGLNGRLFILPTYTAMLELQRILAKSGVKKHYWENDQL